MKPNSARTPSIPDLWRELRGWLSRALANFGGPAFVLTLLTRTTQTAVRRRLQLLESLLMKLLVIEAARLSSCPACGGGADPGARPGEAAERVRIQARRKPEDPSRPETWRVRFRPRLHGIITRIVSEQGARSLIPTQHTPAISRARSKARALARRFESLRRVIADPRRAIAAFARRLSALGRVARAVAHAIALSRPPRSIIAPPALAQALVHANDAACVFHNTS